MPKALSKEKTRNSPKRSRLYFEKLSHLLLMLAASVSLVDHHYLRGSLTSLHHHCFCHTPLIPIYRLIALTASGWEGEFSNSFWASKRLLRRFHCKERTRPAITIPPLLLRCWRGNPSDLRCPSSLSGEGRETPTGKSSKSSSCRLSNRQKRIQRRRRRQHSKKRK